MKLDLKEILRKYENLFLIIGLVFGTALVFVNPPFHSNDEDRHYLHAYAISQGDFYPERGTEFNGSHVPVNLLRSISMLQGIPYHQGARLKPIDIEKFKSMPLDAENSQFSRNPQLRHNPLPFIPHAIAIKLCFVDNPVWRLYFARVGGLILYLLLVFLSIRIIPIFKPFLFIFALTPMLLFQAASVTYDTMNIALSFLIFSFSIKYSLTDAKLSPRALLMILCILIIHRFAKDGYVLLPLLFLIIPKSKFSTQTKAIGFYISIIILTIFLYYLPNLTWYKFIGGLGLHSEPALKKDFLHSFGMNLELFLTKPIEGVSNVASSIFYHRQEWFAGIVGRFGYSYTKLPQAIIILHGLVLFAVAFYNPKSKYSVEKWKKIVIFIIGVLSVGLIILGFYLNSPVGAVNIFGLQGRYFIPIIPLILFALYNQEFANKKLNESAPAVLAIYSSLVLLYTINFILDGFYL
jgi:uncharacterized membrane protein